MDLVIVDTTVWIDYLRNTSTPQTEWLDRELPYRPFGLIDLTLCEVLQGISNPSVFEQVKRKLLAFHIIESGGEDIAIQAARRYQALRSKGIAVRKTIDCIIATCCIDRGFALLHNDRDFDPFETHHGLRVVPVSRSPARIH